MKESIRGNISPEQKLIVDQYTRVVGKLDEMFQVMRPRIAGEFWRLDGIGTCRIDKSSSEIGLIGPSALYIIDLREQRNVQASGQRFDESVACSYHRLNKGCVLADLKSPYCISHVDYPEELEKRFRIDGYKLIDDINAILLPILLGEVDDDFVQLACEAIKKMTDYIGKFPVLSPEEIEKTVSFFRGDKYIKRK